MNYADISALKYMDYIDDIDVAYRESSQANNDDENEKFDVESEYFDPFNRK